MWQEFFEGFIKTIIIFFVIIICIIPFILVAINICSAWWLLSEIIIIAIIGGIANAWDIIDYRIYWKVRKK